MIDAPVAVSVSIRPEANGGVVDLAYEDKAPYAFTGTVKEVVFDLKTATAEHEHALHEYASIHSVAHGISA
jgi:hypothetical protein